MEKLSRRNFVKSGAIATLGMSISPFSPFEMRNEKKVKIGIIGVGNRGTSLMNTLLGVEGVEIVAVCDLFQAHVDRAAARCVKAGRKAPRTYCKNGDTWKSMLDNEKLDAVIIATYWDSHAAIGLYAMTKGIYTGIEVPAALTVEDTWKLVETSEKTGVAFMMLENWSFRQDNLALLNMKRLGLLGDILHCHCAHSHNCIDHWFFDKATGEQRWPAKYLLEYNRDQYPTHSIGPVLSWLDINCGDVFTEIYATASASRGINDQIKRKFGENHPNAKLTYKQGDIVTSTLKTKMGKTVVINYDMQLPRPYSNRWMLQGLKGVYMEEKESIYLTGLSPELETWEPWKPYEKKYNHSWWKDGSDSGGHGGADFIMLTQFVQSIQQKQALPLDIYDSAVMSAIVELSGISIEKNAPVEFPDFTKGLWKTRKPYFALDKNVPG